MQRFTVVGLVLTAGAGLAIATGWRIRTSAERAEPVAASQQAAPRAIPGTAPAAELQVTPAAELQGIPRAQATSGVELQVTLRAQATSEADLQATPWAEPPATPGTVESHGIAGATSLPAEGARGPEDRAGETAASALPWLHNFGAVAASAEASAGVVNRMAQWRAPDPSCPAAAYGGLAIAADVTREHGTEEVLASYTQGVLVLDAGGRLIASAPAPECGGSADEVEAIAAGDAQLDGPVIALAATGGGHRESSTWLGLYRVMHGSVAPIFVGTVEDRVGERTRTGDVTLLPGALLYRAPSGEQTLWVYRPEQQHYVKQALVLPPGA